MTNRNVKVLVLGAHPDDAEFHAGGLLAAHRKLGHTVRVVSVTNGASGHHELPAQELIQVRRAEADAVVALTGFEYAVWPFPDGELQPTLEVRQRIIREIRTYQPDLVLTHRVNDYHPDHRAVGQAVQDASFLVTVPRIVPEVPAVRVDPVVAYMTDFFTRPNPLRPDVVLRIDTVFDEVVRMLDCHRSQVYEWLPYNLRLEDAVPRDGAARLAWLDSWFARRSAAVADRFRDALKTTYGEAEGGRCRFAEAYEFSEYAGNLAEERRTELFPLLPGASS